MNNIESCLKVLELKKGASKEDIKKAYREKSKTCHPNSNHPESSHERFVRLHDAYQYLIDSSLLEDDDKKDESSDSSNQYVDINNIENATCKYIRRNRIIRIIGFIAMAYSDLSEIELVEKSVALYRKICFSLRENGLGEFFDNGMFDIILSNYAGIYQKQANIMKKTKERKRNF